LVAIWRSWGDKLGKFLVVRRDGSVPKWPPFVLGARDPAAPYALRAYAAKCRALKWDEEYIASVLEEANAFEAYAAKEGAGDPPASPHRTDDPAVLEAMRGNPSTIHVRPDAAEVRVEHQR
jgi:hypothetical protein